MPQDVQDIARALAAEGKGILAAGETARTLTWLFDPIGIPSIEENRRNYREMFTTPGAAKFVSGVILQDETIRRGAG